MTTQKISHKEISINELFAKAIKVFDHDTYANNVQVALTPNELFIDYYYVSPLINKGLPVAEYVQRLVLPVALAKGLASALANVIAAYEAENETTLPNSRQPDENDRVNLWP